MYMPQIEFFSECLAVGSPDNLGSGEKGLNGLGMAFYLPVQAWIFQAFLATT